MGEKGSGQEYRDNLADKLKGMRNSDEDNPDVGRAKAKGYLESERDSKRYKTAKEHHQHEQVEIKNKKEWEAKRREIEENGLRWLFECCKDREKAEKFITAVRSIADRGLVHCRAHNTWDENGELKTSSQYYYSEDLKDEAYSLIEEIRDPGYKHKLFDFDKFSRQHPTIIAGKSNYHDPIYPGLGIDHIIGLDKIQGDSSSVTDYEKFIDPKYRNVRKGLLEAFREKFRKPKEVKTKETKQWNQKTKAIEELEKEIQRLREKIKKTDDERQALMSRRKG